MVISLGVQDIEVQLYFIHTLSGFEHHDGSLSNKRMVISVFPSATNQICKTTQFCYTF